MRTASVIRQLLRKSSLPAVCLVAMGYFGHHALFDDHGLRRLLSLREEVSQREAALQAEQAKRSTLETRVNGLRPQRIDPDLLDERARETLGLARPDEIIIFKQK